MKTPTELPTRLDYYYQQIKTIILARQNPITGLLPASTAITAHGDYTDAWVRDNVYSILAVWGLALAYRKIDNDQGRTYELEYSVVKLMRGLLFAMMRQAHKVEKFKHTQSLLDGLHAKYNTATGDIVVGDDEWGHLQLDATSIYLLMLAEMTAAGLSIIFTLDEVNFVQNLVYYIGRAYRTPDYGIWERGNKINHGKAELNASSLGMAKAALEAINGLNLFGVHGSQASVIHVLPDEISRARITLESLLPRESASKEVDAALLSIISYPAFAVEDAQLRERTYKEIINKLAGKYGCKRFLRDGHQTILEDTHRLHYEPWELKQFEDIECEWPLFFTYLVLDGIFRQDQEQVQKYQELLAALLVERDGFQLLPELYYVPEEKIEAEKLNPHSQTRLPNENIPLVWAQSLYFLGQMLSEGLIAVGDIDPLGRHLCVGKKREAMIQIALLAENEEVQAQLEVYGIESQTPNQVEPIQVRQAGELSEIYTQIGRNDQLGLTGRPVRRLRSLTTSRIFKIQNQTVVFLPAFLDAQQFYLTLDYHFLLDQIRGELAYIQKYWSDLGRPILTLMITRTMLETGSDALLALMQELKNGVCGGVQVKLGKLNQLMLTGAIQRIDFITDIELFCPPVKNARLRCYYLVSQPEKNWRLGHTQEFQMECETNLDLLLSYLRSSENIYEQIELLQTLNRLKGLDFDTGYGEDGYSVTVGDLLDEVYTKAGYLGLWAVVRRAAGLRQMVDIGLSDAVTSILVRGKQIAVGRAYSEASLIIVPKSHHEIAEKINNFCREDIRDRVLTQEILIYLGVLIKTEPELFKGLLTLRVGYLILLITSELAQELGVTQDEAYDHLMQLSPYEVKLRLEKVLTSYSGVSGLLRQQESLHIKQKESDIAWVVQPVISEDEIAVTPENWRRFRQAEGAINRVPKDFFKQVWLLMHHCKGLVIGDKLERRNRLESEVMISEMTAGERNFALRIEHLLNKIEAPEYRQVNVEALMELGAIAANNPNLQIQDYIVLDVLIGHAVRLAWLEKNPERGDRYDEDKGLAWPQFYNTSPRDCANYILKALKFLTEFARDF
ncbi:MAG: glycoside hydrolase family 15 protein [Sphaerospermopsis kisseleviana]|uniref:Glycoside hydrolase family 15 protein n=2 Tax=Sphaerospermopsis TaxID=752201 RepID=A0ABR9VF43_9CYAN|nr:MULTISPECIES: glycoside hydrolase family 15 protein [Sphaerospermopsis]BAZ81931.1 phosphorylase kinase alphabeta [Sphaerospermopsis kisseleviana NIES-73]MBD2132198.1 glycoside hydrolase family 15 protein [Sphaerospermopsis sp. FACHB-1094]MBD2144936.1 glycoside hydrolase family 15 protein [Sphaerospermopsis sp. FACHB-1194]MBE9236025.1 glycoside hydrolase family 15 protein [Sphaerospermopsis aphanizomenoides LEGE 00250]MDB9440841.1 glycoside hydrolase family 15 protein [Sphaerospermopsis kiss